VSPSFLQQLNVKDLKNISILASGKEKAAVAAIFIEYKSRIVTVLDGGLMTLHGSVLRADFAWVRDDPLHFPIKCFP
jgi:hypothetical protein